MIPEIFEALILSGFLAAGIQRCQLSLAAEVDGNCTPHISSCVGAHASSIFISWPNCVK